MTTVQHNRAAPAAHVVYSLIAAPHGAVVGLADFAATYEHPVRQDYPRLRRSANLSSDREVNEWLLDEALTTLVKTGFVSQQDDGYVLSVSTEEVYRKAAAYIVMEAETEIGHGNPLMALAHAEQEQEKKSKAVIVHATIEAAVEAARPARGSKGTMTKFRVRELAMKKIAGASFAKFVIAPEEVANLYGPDEKVPNFDGITRELRRLSDEVESITKEPSRGGTYTYHYLAPGYQPQREPQRLYHEPRWDKVKEVVALHEAHPGWTHARIAVEANISKSAVSNYLGRDYTATRPAVPQARENVLAMHEAQPEWNIRELARELNMAYTTVWTWINGRSG
jgi:hypothetical protein